jgi:hypothetical protein
MKAAKSRMKTMANEVMRSMTPVVVGELEVP